eukprot:CAMPEP_0117680020 /NCGR_PEP_ID=MMETSP0804-20121206/18115_1 /TAXON_ID=1074897 /ORGANISM="Tetraselmis astigmatica, Strain CCMP880" /LENGTH=110 /DNA_ID=CAMNT_0005489461 /DNA_START=742 /DNA_END=1074 /DNA_ORIENTATION=+
MENVLSLWRKAAVLDRGYTNQYNVLLGIDAPLPAVDHNVVHLKVLCQARAIEAKMKVHERPAHGHFVGCFHVLRRNGILWHEAIQGIPYGGVGHNSLGGPDDTAIAETYT